MIKIHLEIDLVFSEGRTRILAKAMITTRYPSKIKWDGSHLGSLKREEVEDKDKIKIGRHLKIYLLTIDGEKILALVKSIDSLLPIIFDEMKPIFGLSKIGTHSFRYGGHLMIAYRPCLVRNNVYLESTLDMADDKLAKKILKQVRLNIAFREVCGITDTLERSFLLRYQKPSNMFEIPTVISFLEPGSIANSKDNLLSVLPQNLVEYWFQQDDIANSLDKAIADLICLNRECPEASFAYYRPLVEETILRIDPELIAYLNFFFTRLEAYIPS